MIVSTESDLKSYYRGKGIAGDYVAQRFTSELHRLLHDRQVAAELGLLGRVRFLGYCDNVAQLLPELDIVVCSSHMETFGICLIEAMACERPVVATRVGGIPEVVEDGTTGLLVSPGQPAELARAVGRLLSDPTLRQQLGRAGRQRVIEHFTNEAQADVVLASYQELLRIDRGASRRPLAPAGG